MGDISHSYGSDLDLSATGDFLYVDGSTEAQQHIIKRLLTSPGDYLWNLTYGAGLGKFVGDPAKVTEITNAVRSQIFLEETVAQVPEPQVTLDEQPNGVVICTIDYTDSQTGQPQTLSFPIGN